MSSTLFWPRRSRLWLIGGTSESIALATEMQRLGIPTIVTVTTESACQAYASLADVEVQIQRFGSDAALHDWLLKSNISGILDASHPFATEISARAIKVGKTLERSYLRFERETLTQLESSYVTELESGTRYLSQDSLQGKRVLLTVGSQALGEFAKWQDCAELFARILPSDSALKLAYQAGFRRDRLIALQPPLSFELEAALWRHWNISLVITKASGHAGGEDVKRQVAEALQIPLLVMKRPAMDYPWQTQSMRTALSFAQRITQPVPPQASSQESSVSTDSC